MFLQVLTYNFFFFCCLAVLLVYRPVSTDLKRFGSIFGKIKCFGLKETCLAFWLRKSFLSGFLVKFDSFQRPLPTFSFVAVSPNCLFLSKFQVLLGVLAKFGEKCFCPKNLFCFLVMKTLSKLFSVCFNSF